MLSLLWESDGRQSLSPIGNRSRMPTNQPGSWRPEWLQGCDPSIFDLLLISRSRILVLPGRYCHSTSILLLQYNLHWMGRIKSRRLADKFHQYRHNSGQYHLHIFLNAPGLIEKLLIVAIVSRIFETGVTGETI